MMIWKTFYINDVWKLISSNISNMKDLKSYISSSCYYKQKLTF